MTFSEWLSQVAASLSKRGWAVTVDYAETKSPYLAVTEAAVVSAWKESLAPWGGRLRVFYANEATQGMTPDVAASLVESSMPWTLGDLEVQRKQFLEGYQSIPQGITEVTVQQAAVTVAPSQPATPAPPAPTTPGKTPTTAEPSQPPAASEQSKGDPALPVDAQVQAAASGGMHTWDEWDYYYHLVTGQHAPAPEARGYAREADGSVKINGRTAFTYAEWKVLAFGDGAAGPSGPPAPSPGAPTSSAPPAGAPGFLANLDLRTGALILIGWLVLRGLLR